MLDVVFLLHIGKGLIYAVSLSVVVHPKPHEVFSVTELVTILGRFLVVFIWGFFDIQCTFIALIALFLCWFWGHDYPVVSWRSKFCLSFSIYVIFLFFSSYTWVLLS